MFRGRTLNPLLVWWWECEKIDFLVRRSLKCTQRVATMGRYVHLQRKNGALMRNLIPTSGLINRHRSLFAMMTRRAPRCVLVRRTASNWFTPLPWSPCQLWLANFSIMMRTSFYRSPYGRWRSDSRRESCNGASTKDFSTLFCSRSICTARHIA